VVTPFNWSGVGGHFQVTTFPGTFAAFGAGVGMLLAAPWVTRAVVAADRWLVRGLLGPGRLTQRVHDLEQTRALAVDNAAERLRRLERDLHDGAQIRLAVSQLLAASRHAGDLDPLTPRERDVLALMAEGRSNAGVAAALVLTLGTVEKHVASIFGKLGLPASETDNRRVLAVLRYLGS
jgi:DNA-binding NarL/FixJ family response regulator